ncbi:MAG: oxaloacetate decarboxylase gamma subunit [Halieaceae bacterium]|jgi:oxaloacetate decarboxylase gamma subunit
MQQTIVHQGLELMLFGMSTVILFLTLLVMMTMTMSRFITRFFPEEPLEVAAASNKPSAQLSDRELVAVISAALHRHRSGK